MSLEASEEVKVNRNCWIKEEKPGRETTLGWCPASLLGILVEHL